MADEWIRLGASRLAIGMGCAPGVAVATAEGTADETALATILEAGVRLLEDDAGVMVWNLRALEGIAGTGGESLVRVMREGQRLGKEIRLVGCGEACLEQLRALGLRGELWHYPSLSAATEGALSEPGHAVTVYLRRERATRARLRLVVASLAAPCGLDEDDQAKVVVALDDLCSLASQTEEAGEEPLTLCFYARDGLLTADVSWRVAPAVSRNLGAVWSRRPSARARLLAALDGVDTLPQGDGILVRLVKQTRGTPVTTPSEAVSKPRALATTLPDTMAKRSTPAASGKATRKGRRSFSWGRWISRPRLALVAGIAGCSVGLGKIVMGGSKNGQGK